MIRFSAICLIVVLSEPAFAFEFSNQECEFKVNFPFPVSVKKVVQPLGNGMYSNTYMAKTENNRSLQVFSANCDTSFKLARSLTVAQMRKSAEWSMDQWSKMIGLKYTQMFWEQQGKYTTLRMVGQRTINAGKRQIKAAVQARMYLGRRSMMNVAVIERASNSPSAAMERFLNTSVSLR